jgi:uncharacterized protein with PIN domain
MKTTCPDCKFEFEFNPHEIYYEHSTLKRKAGTAKNMFYSERMNREYVVCPSCNIVEHQFSAEARELDDEYSIWYSTNTK